MWRTRVQWSDTDAAGIHHNTAIARWAEAAEQQLARQCGLDGYFAVAPRVRYEADFTAPLRPGQAVRAEVWVERAGTSSLTLAFEVWGEPEPFPGDAGDGAAPVLAASGRYTTVHVGGDGGTPGAPRSAPWPDGWVAALTGDGRAGE